MNKNVMFIVSMETTGYEIVIDQSLALYAKMQRLIL